MALISTLSQGIVFNTGNSAPLKLALIIGITITAVNIVIIAMNINIIAVNIIIIAINIVIIAIDIIGHLNVKREMMNSRVAQSQKQ